MQTETRKIQIQKNGAHFGELVTDVVAVEEPLEIRLDYVAIANIRKQKSVSITMRTPGHDDELAAGFLLTEGIIRSRGDVLQIAPCGRNEFGNVIDVQLAPLVNVDFEKLTRHVFASSSCGLCGKATIEAIQSQFAPIVPDDSCVESETLLRLPAKMRAVQSTFERTGGLHAAAMFDQLGELLVIREDVGRHNAVDKVIGSLLLGDREISTSDILLVSGRSSFEIVQKAVAAGIAIIAAISAPSSLAVEFARQNNQTLIGFLRDDRMNIYAGASRILIAAEAK